MDEAGFNPKTFGPGQCFTGELKQDAFECKHVDSV
jgi:hypothetical protein